MFCFVKTQKLLGHDDPFFASIKVPANVGESISLQDLQYLFAIQKVDPRYGRVIVQQFRLESSIPGK